MEKGGLTTFKNFYLEHHQTMLHLAMTYRPLQAAEDIVQDSFIRIFERWDTFESTAHVRSALYVYIKNACISEIRHENTINKYQENVSAIGNSVTDTNIEDELIWHETYRLLSKAIQNLPPQGKRVIQLSLEGHSNQEIADTLNLSINTVKLYKSNAYKKLRKDFQESESKDVSYLIAISFILWSLQPAISQ